MNIRFQRTYYKALTANNIDILIFIVLFFLFFINIYFSEKIEIGNVFGWDGQHYAAWVRDFPNVLFQQIDSYRIVRIFPSACVNIMMRVFKIELTNYNIRLVWESYNLLMILISIIFSIKISNFLKFTLKAKLLAIILLFFNLYMLKIWMWCPVITDVTAFALTIVLFYSYLKRNYWMQFIISIIGYFTWPTFVLLSAILFIFPYINYRKNLNEDFYTSKNKMLHVILGILFGVLILYLFKHYFFLHNKDYFQYFPSAMLSFLYLSLVLILLYLFIGYKLLVYKPRIIFLIYNFFNRYFWTRVGITLLFLIVLLYLKQLLASGGKSIHGIDFILAYCFNSPLIRPLNNHIAHIIWFGPMYILILFYAGNIIEKMTLNGNVGILIIMFFGFIMSMNSESRYLITFIPILIFYFVLSIHEYINNKQIVVIALSQLIFSKIWYKINMGDVKDWTNPFEFPAQNYFMNAGPWISNQMYLVHCFVILIFIIIFYKFGLFKFEIKELK